MKIALMTNNYKPFLGGVSISVERLAKGLEEKGHQVTIFAPTYEEQLEEENVFRYKTWMKKFIGGIVLPNPFDRKIELEFQRNSYDIIHVHHPMLIGRTAVYLSKKYNIPLVFTYHTRYEQYLSYVKGIRIIEEHAKDAQRRFHNPCWQILHVIQDKIVPAYLHTFLKHCDFVLAPTKGMQEYLTTTCRVSPEKTAILPTGIEKQHFLVSDEEADTLRKKYQATDVPFFLSVSRMSHEKNVDFLLRSIQKVKERYQKPFKVLMVGDGPNKKEYEQSCAKLQLENEVIFTGTVPNAEIAPYFKAADAFIFASKTETQGIVILEAMAGSTPVYALNASGVSDLVSNGKNGFLSPENMDIYSKKIMDFLTGKDDRKHLSNSALETALDYREEAVAAKAIQFYNSVIGLKCAESDKSNSYQTVTAK